MTRARAVLNAIDEATHIARRHPVMYARMSRAGCSVGELAQAYDLYLAGISTRWWFSGERRSYTEGRGVDRSWTRERTRRRARGKAQRQARKANRG